MRKRKRHFVSPKPKIQLAHLQCYNATTFLTKDKDAYFRLRLPWQFDESKVVMKSMSYPAYIQGDWPPWCHIPYWFLIELESSNHLLVFQYTILSEDTDFPAYSDTGYSDTE